MIKTVFGKAVPAALQTYDPATDFRDRESQVQSYYAEGEFLHRNFGADRTNTVAGQETAVAFGNQQVSQFTMHSQALLTAGLLSPQFADATVRVQSFLPLLTLASYYTQDTERLATRIFCSISYAVSRRILATAN